MEAPGGTLLVNEVNHTPEFHGAVKATDVDVAGRIVDYVLAAAGGKSGRAGIDHSRPGVGMGPRTCPGATPVRGDRT
jgi:hypothetical protein